MIADGKVRILLQKPETVRLEQCFPGMRVVSKTPFAHGSVSFDFNGTGFVLRGGVFKAGVADGVVTMEVTVDGGLEVRTQDYVVYDVK